MLDRRTPCASHPTHHPIKSDDAHPVHVNDFRGKVPEYPKTFGHVLVPTDSTTTPALFTESVKVESTRQRIV